MASGCYYISILLRGVTVPHRGQSPLHQRHRLFLGVVQRGVHVRHLWGGRQVLTIHICKVLQPRCPCGAGHSPFCLIAIFRVHLTNIVQAPSFAWSVHKLYWHQVSLWDDTRAMDDPLGSPCAWCILWTPLGLIPHESWVQVIPHHSTAWLDWSSTQYECNLEREHTRLLS